MCEISRIRCHWEQTLSVNNNSILDVPQIPGDLNLKDFNVARRTLEKASGSNKKSKSGGKGAVSNMFIGEAVTSSSSPGFLNLSTTNTNSPGSGGGGELDSDFGADYAEKNYSEVRGALEGGTGT